MLEVSWSDALMDTVVSAGRSGGLVGVAEIVWGNQINKADQGRKRRKMRRRETREHDWREGLGAKQDGRIGGKK